MHFRVSLLGSSLKLGAAALMLGAVLCGSASAGTNYLLFEEEDYMSDLQAASSISGSYDAGTDAFEIATGFTGALDVGAGTAADFTSIGSITSSGVEIDAAGNVVSAGLITIIKSVGTSPHANGVFLEGPVEYAQFDGTGVLQLQFTANAGEALADFGGLWAPVGILLNMAPGGGSGGAAVDFSSSFSYGIGSTIDVIGAIPEPSTFVLGLSGAAFVCSITTRRRKSRRQERCG